MPKPQHRMPQTLNHDTAGGAILRHARPTTRPAIRNLRALDIHRSPRLETLDLAHLPQLSAVHLHRCTGARHIALPDGIQRLTITDQPDLAAITGCGHVLHVTRTPATECSLHGLWSQALFDDARIRVLREFSATLRVASLAQSARHHVLNRVQTARRNYR